MPTDPVALATALIRCPSVTPAEAGALTLAAGWLEAAGFRVTRTDRGGVPNLFARWGSGGPVLGFNGHTDVVPPGDATHWRHDPFGAAEEDGFLYGRGASDMKSGVGAFLAAAIDHVRAAPPDHPGSLVITLTGDEEGASIDGTLAILDWMETAGERIDHCIVGEPTSAVTLGDMIKIGRRGSLTLRITAYGVQGHTAYPERARNPLHALVRLLDRLASHPLDEGTDHFGPSTLAIATIDTGNPANNVIPAEARATLNIRFNDAHSGQGLIDWVDAEADAAAAEFGVGFSVRSSLSGSSFVTAPGPFSDLISAAIEAETGQRPELSTTGGTSDARFIKDHCPVVEVGLAGPTMHQTDERVEIAQIHGLKAIYGRIIASYFAAPPG